MDSEVTPTTTVYLDLGRWTDVDLVQECPSKKNTTYKIPANDPDYHASGNSDDNRTNGDGASTDGDCSSSSDDGSNAGTVHPGSFCSQPGATDVSKAGTPMVCGPGSDGRNRWRSS
ncbi:hypothetical protein [Streptomyces griseicoloratus]|uniref:hypothetical protein n=1 Tax=Streptomyces griseicoloratus TaxID=2752516 RepID=UPI001CB6E332|nr:hypothetical protein [Streptomyces griseicoloratus]